MSISSIGRTIPASPTASGRAPRLDTIAGVPDAIASKGVKPHPSNNDGYLLLNFKVEFYLPPDLFSFSKAFKAGGPRRNIQRRRRR